MHRRHILLTAALLLLAWSGLALVPAQETPPEKKKSPPPMDAAKGESAEKADDQTATENDSKVSKELLSGKVVFAVDALKRKGIKPGEELKGQVVLETEEGEIFPIVPDWRGRAFFQDERLRERQVDLVVRRKPGVPYLQVLMVFTYDDEGVRQYTDYWCDICSIPMYEIKDCECCQGPTRLRFQSQELPADLKLDAHSEKQTDDVKTNNVKKSKPGSEKK